ATLAYAYVGTDPYYGQVLVWFYLNSLLALSMRLVMLTGEVNLAHASFFGIGAYAAGVLSARYHVWFLVAMAVAAVLTAATAAVFGSLALRVRGAYFLLISFALAEVVRLAFGNLWEDVLGGVSGLTGIPTPAGRFSGVMVTVLLVLLVILYILERSDLGRVFRAIQNSNDLAEAVGIDVFRYKLLALVVASTLAGIAGGLFAHFNTIVTPEDFSFRIAIFILAYVIIGGRKEFAGPIVGAVVLTILSEYLRGFGAYEPLAYGVAMLVVMILVPDGIVGALRQWAWVVFTRGAALVRRPEVGG
ncbi:MAG: branched-chain amino acid ABC transporter permease, partial [Clostridia bacterium]|nr:branched-chain amino acid ABC transporter permease [Clostridia bacterium]